MKKKLIVMMIISMMSFTLMSCGNKKEAGVAPSNSVANNLTTTTSDQGDNGEKKLNKITKDEAIKIHEDNIVRLKAFYDNNNIPYVVRDIYNATVAEGNICFEASRAEYENINVGNLDFSTYDFSKECVISADISLYWNDNLDLNNSLAVEYTEAILNEKIDFTEAMKEVNTFVKNYKENPSTPSLKYKIETENYVAEVGMIDMDSIGVSILSTYEVE